MEKITQIKTAIKNLNIFQIVLRKLGYILYSLDKQEIPARIGKPETVVGLLCNNMEKPICYLVKEGKWFSMITYSLAEDEGIEKEVNKIKQEYVRTEILKTAVRYGWNHVSQKKSGEMCRIVLSV